MAKCRISWPTHDAVLVLTHQWSPVARGRNAWLTERSDHIDGSVSSGSHSVASVGRPSRRGDFELGKDVLNEMNPEVPTSQLGVGTTWRRPGAEHPLGLSCPFNRKSDKPKY